MVKDADDQAMSIPSYQDMPFIGMTGSRTSVCSARSPRELADSLSAAGS